MGNEKVVATAVVTLKLKVYCTQPWSGKELIENIHKRAKSEAFEKVARLIPDNNDFHIIRDSISIGVITHEEKE